MPNTNYLTVPKNMQRVLFLSALLCLMTHVIPKKIKVTENTGKSFRVYDTEKNDYTTKNTGQLDFSQGKWIYFADSHRLEFHSKFSGFLDFSGLGSRFYKSMYLDTPKRVLVFPLAPRRNAANKLYPFVGRSMLLFGKPDQNQDTIFDTMFSDYDSILREMGVGDAGVAKRIKAMAEGFTGRMHAYDDGLPEVPEDDPERATKVATLKQALIRNLYREEEPASDVLETMTHYVYAQARHLARLSDGDVVAGRVSFAVMGSMAGRAA